MRRHVGRSAIGLITYWSERCFPSRADTAKIDTAPDIVFANMVELAAAWRARRI